MNSKDEKVEMAKKNKVIIDTYELSHEKMVPTAYLLQHYDQKLGPIETYFVLGSDIISSMTQWEDYNYL